MTDRDTVAALLTRAQRAAVAGGDVAMGLFRTDLDAETKRDKNDLVTRADRETQERIQTVLESGSGPTLPMVAEETDPPGEIPESGATWVVDPIDGTSSYARGSRHWAVSVAFVAYGEPVVAVTHCPALSDTYAAEAHRTERNATPVATSDRTDPETFVVAPVFGREASHREPYRAVSDALLSAFADCWRVGSGHVAMGMVATGELDGAVTTLELNPWDTVGGVHLIRQAGGVVTDLDGERWRHDSDSLVASNGRAHETVLERCRAALE